jgi:hypothetical protein
LRLPRVSLERGLEAGVEPGLDRGPDPGSLADAADDDLLRALPHDFADARRILPLEIVQATDGRRQIRVAMADPLDFDAVEEIELSTHCSVDPMVARSDEIGRAILRRYRGLITKLIPRAQAASPQAHLQALIDLLVEKKVIPPGAYEDSLARLLKR